MSTRSKQPVLPVRLDTVKEWRDQGYSLYFELASYDSGYAIKVVLKDRTEMYVERHRGGVRVFKKLDTAKDFLREQLDVTKFRVGE